MSVPADPPDPAALPDHVDVIIVGAGLSGIGAGCMLRRRCPDQSFVIFEARDRVGGTWDLFRFPGVRSDSDMFALGYSFRPWQDSRAIADGASIRDYVEDTARAYDLDGKIRFGHRVRSADWDGGTGRWTVTVEDGTGSTKLITCRWLSVCAGYYDYADGHRPAFPGEDQFTGTVVHPQHWPEELDCTGRRVIVIGSGATAITLVPALARSAEQVIMLQRTPSYIVSQPTIDPLVGRLPRWLPGRLASWIVRWKNILTTSASYRFARRRPEAMKQLLRRGLRHALPEPYDLDTHFTPPYQPWDQRLCVVTDGDLFRALREGRAEVVTDRIDTFTPTGIRLRSGRQLDADIIVTATGLALRTAGGIRLSVDGAPVDPGHSVTYKGMMLCGVPNLTMVIGYVNASWTLRADLINRYLTRLLRHLDRHGYDYAVPQPPPEGATGRPLLDLRSGYIERADGVLPHQAGRAPWRIQQSYLREVWPLRHGPLRDRSLRFGRVRARTSGDHLRPAGAAKAQDR
ncbi:flavin-containing monooxygenase [Microlunatus speluncae]|uniref:flavin-containing monooxygenase n=1 Tax=Microlunatus speluncae TaxID=2594267 RepID=UPI0012665338|nr:NAD(P)/FAD-dependent oxidoreductase [Microlunatus speluncae]